MGTATLLKTIPEGGAWSGVAKVYRLDPPLVGFETVTVDAMGPEHIGKSWVERLGLVDSEPETSTFPTDEDGNLDHADLRVEGAADAFDPGVLKGVVDHDASLRALGYEVTA